MNLTTCRTGVAVLAALLCAFFAFPEKASAVSADECASQGWDYLLHKSDERLAEEYGKKALEADNKNYKAHELLAAVYKMQGRYGAMFEHAVEMFGQDRMENVLYEWEFDYLDTPRNKSVWMSPQQSSRLEKRIRSILDSGSVPETTQRTWLRWLLANLYLESGRLEKAKLLLSENGFIKDWLVIGSFENRENMGYYEEYPPEKGIDLNASYDGVRWKVKWKKLSHLRFDGVLDMREVMQPDMWACAYALTFINSLSEQDAALRIGGDDAFKVWVNDRVVLEDDTAKCFVYDQHVIGVKLRKGWNKVLVKLCQNEGQWLMGARLTTLKGEPLSGITYSCDPGNYVHFTNEPVPDEKPAPSGVEQYFKSILSSRPDDERARYYLARWYKQVDMKEDAIREYEELMARNPDCAQYHLEAGVVYLNGDKPAKALAEFEKAIALDPNYAEAQFRLGKYYLSKGLYDKSEKCIRKVLAINPEFAEAHVYMGLLNEYRKRNDEAYLNLKEALKINPYFALAAYNFSIYAGRKGFAQERTMFARKTIGLQYSDGNPRDVLIHDFNERGQYEDSIREYREFMKVYDRIDLYIDIADCYMKEKKYREAEEECRKALSRSPEYYLAYTKLGLISYQQGKVEEAKKYWDTAIAYKPDYVWLREYMKSIFPAKNAVFDKYTLSEKERDKIIAGAPDEKDYPGAQGIILYDQSIEQVFSDGSYTEYGHRIVKVASESGRHRFGTARLSNSETLKIKKAVTIKPGGEEVEPTHIEGGNISFASVDIGSIVEYEYTVEKYDGGWLKNHFYGFFYFHWDEGPLLLGQYVLAMPPDKELKVTSRGEIKYSEGIVDNNKVRIWTAENVPQLYPEAMRPPFRDLSSFVGVSTILSWDYLIKWENSLIVDQYKTDAKLREKIKSLTNDKKTLDARIRALYNYVTTDVRYLSAGNSGIFGVKPHKAVNVFTDGYGVCKDKACLLIAMLREIGVDSYFALIKTKNAGELMKELPVPWFNHAIVYIVPQKGAPGVFADPTSLYLSYADLWSEEQGVNAFVNKDGKYEFIKTPVIPAESSKLRIAMAVDIDKDGDIKVLKDEESSGFFASSARSAYSNTGRRKEILEEELNKDIPGVRISTFTFSTLENLDTNPSVHVEFSAPSFARITGGKMYFKPVSRQELTEKFARKSERRFDVNLPALLTVVSNEEFTVPPGYKISAVPENTALDNEWMKYKAVYTVKGNSILCEREFILKTRDIKNKDYRRFRDFCVNVDAEENKEIILAKKQGK